MRDEIFSPSELERHYDLAPSPALAAEMADIYAKMDRVVSDWAIHAPYVAAINKLKKSVTRSSLRITT